MMLCSHHHYRIPEPFHHPKGTLFPLGVTPRAPPPLPQPLATTGLLSVSDLPVLGTSDQWSHAVHGLCLLVSLSLMFLSPPTLGWAPPLSG